MEPWLTHTPVDPDPDPRPVSITRSNRQVTCNGVRPRVYGDWHGARRGPSNIHEGQDIFAAKGARVYAMAAGRVRTGRSTRSGNYVKLVLPNNRGHLYYAHLDTVDVQNGERVEAGDVLGTLGRTGNASEKCPHLHIHYRGPGGARKVNLMADLAALDPGMIPRSLRNENWGPRIGTGASSAGPKAPASSSPSRGRCGECGRAKVGE